MKMSRRGFLAVAGGTGAALTLTNCGSEAKPAQAGEPLRSKAPLPEPFKVPLPIPPVKKPIRTDSNADYYRVVQQADYYRVVQQKASLEILPRLKTEVQGYDGLLPGPTFDVRSGRHCDRAFQRARRVDRRPPAWRTGSGPQRRLAAGCADASRRPPGTRRTPPCPAATWRWAAGPTPTRTRSAPPCAGITTTRWTTPAPQVYRGLFGLHLIRDDEEDRLPLPSGDREIPLVIADRAFAADGSFLYPATKDGPGVETPYMEGSSPTLPW